MFGLDKGFIVALTDNDRCNKNVKLIKNSILASEAKAGLDVHFLYDSHSLTLMRTQFDKIKEIVERGVVKNKHGRRIVCNDKVYSWL